MNSISKVIIIILIFRVDFCLSKNYESEDISFFYPYYTELIEFKDSNGTILTLKSKNKNIITISYLNEFTTLKEFSKQKSVSTKKFLTTINVGSSNFSPIKECDRFSNVSELIEKFSISVLFNESLMFRHYFYQKKNKNLIVIIQGGFIEYDALINEANIILSSLFESMKSDKKIL